MAKIELFKEDLISFQLPLPLSLKKKGKKKKKEEK